MELSSSHPFSYYFMYKISRIKETWGVFRFGRLTTLTTSLSLPPVTTTTTNTFPRYSLVKAFYLLFFLAVCVFVYVFNNSFTIPVSFHRIQLSLSLCIILAQVCVLCSWSSLESNYKLEGGGEPYMMILFTGERISQLTERWRKISSKSRWVCFFFFLWWLCCCCCLLFAITHPWCASLSRLFSRAVLTHSLLFRRIYFKYTIEM